MKLHIGNLSKSVTDEDLKDVLVAVAAPVTLVIVKDHTGASKGFAFAEFATEEEGQAVIAAVNGKEMSGQAIKLGVARPRKGEMLES
jgi:RNA recognition motif-containing protein